MTLFSRRDVHRAALAAALTAPGSARVAGQPSARDQDARQQALWEVLARHWARADDRVAGLVFHRASGALATGYADGTVEIARPGSSVPALAFKAHQGSAAGLVMSRSGDLLMSNSYFDEQTRVWSARTGELLHTIGRTRGPVIETEVAALFIVGGVGSTLHLYQPSRQLSPPAVPAISGVPEHFAYHAAASTLAVATASGTVDLWRLDGTDAAGELWRAASSAPTHVGLAGVQFGRDPGSIWTIDKSGAIAQWSVAPLKMVHTFPTAFKRVNAARFSTGGNHVAIVGTSTPGGIDGGFVELISLTDGRVLHHLPASNVSVVAFTPDDELLVVISQNRLQLLRVT